MKPFSNSRLSLARRLYAGAFCLLFVVGWLSVSAHEGLTEHVICPIHGELLEIGPAATASVDTVGPTHGLHFASDKHEMLPEHQICSVALAGGQRASLPTSIGHVVSIARASVPVVPVEARPRGSDVPIFRLAPKQSPPVLQA